ncbi:MAG TPA: hypothetical protein VJU14_00625 [Solirubrobacterales bacterium]|nr:hypothetical protein [Solirubrobacterales bacterium]
MDKMKSQFLGALSALVLLLFAGIWIWIGIKLLAFDATSKTPALSFSEAQVTVAGFLASAVGAGTASVLGVEIQSVQRRDAQRGQLRAMSARVGEAATSSWLLLFGIALYAVVGCFVLIVWVFNSEVAPEMVNAFSLGVLGWLAGAFAAVFRAQDG